MAERPSTVFHGREPPAEADGRPAPVDAGGEDGEDQSPRALWEQGVDEGERRLHRSLLSATATGLVGGIDVMVGVGIAAVVSGALSLAVPAKLASVLGSLVFGIGFVLIAIGRSELSARTS
jgi:formate/nitrite transporter FocA (FNT family)